MGCFWGKKRLWWVRRCSFPLKSFATQFLQIVQGAVAMPSDLQGKIGKYCREINWLKGKKTIYREFIECEIERLKKKRSSCDRRLNSEKKKKSFGELKMREKPRKKINV